MKVYDIGQTVDKKGYVVAVGMFDGVHLGHQKIISELVAEAKRLNTESLVFTFDIHPRAILHKNAPKKILTKEDKVKMLEKLGVDNVVFSVFNYEIAYMSAKEFVEDIFVKELGVKSIIIGENHRFGNKQQGDYSFLKKMSEEYDFNVIKVPPVLYNGQVISSTLVRKSILEGKLRLTKELLGRFYSIKGVIGDGDRRASHLGFPTANFEDVETKLPLDGVYASYVELENKIYPAMTYIGYSPTYGGDKRKVETHIFNFNGKIYGETLRLFFVARIREGRVFSNEEELKKTLMIDKNITLNILADEDLLVTV